jgi:sugar phosphate isomerase/epimerase
MKIAVSSPRFSLVPFKEMLEKISKHFIAWEIIAEGEHHLWNIEDELRQLQASYDLEIFIHAPLSDINIGSLNSSMRKESLRQITETLRIMSKLDLGLLTLHPGNYSPLGLLVRQKVKNLCKEALKEIGKIGRNYNIKIALENMPKQSFTLAHTLSELLELADKNVGLCFDVGHANTTKDLDSFLTYSGKFINIHLHDNSGRKDEHLPLGRGNIDFKRVLAILIPKYENYFVIEANNLEEAIESKNYFENYLAE